MPLIVITGLPCSGKTKRTLELKEFFETKQLTVTIISEDAAIQKAGYNKNTYFAGLLIKIFLEIMLQYIKYTPVNVVIILEFCKSHAYLINKKLCLQFKYLIFY